jgi:hypothetical protein
MGNMGASSMDFVRRAVIDGTRSLDFDADGSADYARELEKFHGTAIANESVRLLHMTFAHRWALCGFPRVVMGHKHAATLMATNTQPSSVGAIAPPWDSLLIDIPAGILTCIHNDAPAVVGVSCFSDVALMFLISDSGDVVGGDVTTSGSLASLGNCTPYPSGSDADECAARQREMVSRLVFGVCLELTEHRPSAEHRRTGTRPVKCDPRGEPVTWTYTLTRDVKVDCRQAVRDYVAGTRSTAPTVQCLVRGHWKRQACGPKLTERKFIFVEPYWRGPEDAPIASRAHVLG